jgi:hypothetical protein
VKTLIIKFDLDSIQEFDIANKKSQQYPHSSYNKLMKESYNKPSKAVTSF